MTSGRVSGDMKRESSMTIIGAREGSVENLRSDPCAPRAFQGREASCLSLIPTFFGVRRWLNRDRVAWMPDNLRYFIKRFVYVSLFFHGQLHSLHNGSTDTTGFGCRRFKSPINTAQLRGGLRTKRSNYPVELESYLSCTFAN